MRLTGVNLVRSEITLRSIGDVDDFLFSVDLFDARCCSLYLYVIVESVIHNRIMDFRLLVFLDWLYVIFRRYGFRNNKISLRILCGSFGSIRRSFFT